MRSFSIAPRRKRSKSGLSGRDTRPLRAPAFFKDVNLPIVGEVEITIIEHRGISSHSAYALFLCEESSNLLQRVTP